MNKFFLICIAVFAAVSCVKENLINSDLKTFSSFIADIDDGDLTKSMLEIGGAVKWETGDVIGVFSDTETTPVRFTLCDDGKFRCEVGNAISGHSFYAFSPFDAFSQDESNPLVLKHSPGANFTGEGFCIPMIAKSNDDKLSFRQTCGILHFHVSGNGVGEPYFVMWGNRDEPFGGACSLDLTEDNPVLRLGDEPESTRQFVNFSAFQMESGLDVWVFVPPMTFVRGFTLRMMFYGTEGGEPVRDISQSTYKSIVVERGKMLTYKVNAGAMQVSQEQLDDERAALVRFYKATGGDNWSDNTGWCTDAPVGEWYGISTIGGLVSDIRLSGNNLSGSLSDAAEPLTHLKECRNFIFEVNNLSGNLPTDLTKLNGWVVFRANPLSGQIPSEFRDWEGWASNWAWIIDDTALDISTAQPNVPSFNVELLDGSYYTDSDLRSNKLTLLFQWSTTCAFSPLFEPLLKQLYEKYKSKGFEIVSWANQSESTVKNYVEEHGFNWITFASAYNNYIGDQLFPLFTTPTVTIYDGDGIMRHFRTSACEEDLIAVEKFVTEWFGDEYQGTQYESTDFSADGSVHVLQTASSGKGIHVILMGDAYSDRLIQDGTYNSVMSKALEEFFQEEPFATYRNSFTVSYVDVVSKNETVDGETTLGTWFGEGTQIGGNLDTVEQYARRTMSETGMETLDDALIVVLVNRNSYAGTCYMQLCEDGDYGRGCSIAFLPAGKGDYPFGDILRHEACGHGFAKLGDEYYYEDYGTIPEDAVSSHKEAMKYGWWPNIDFVSDPSSVKWTNFLTDARYQNEGLGVFEGALSYLHGVWRPTMSSIMRYNTGGFNAPSRYAIWYRINKLAYGAEWTGAYEDFVTWDLAHRNAAPARPASRSRAPEKPLPPLAPPVVIWR